MAWRSTGDRGADDERIRLPTGRPRSSRGSHPRWQTGVVVYVFGDCRLDLRRYELQRGGEVRPIEPQVFDVLVLLVRERDRVVTKEELLDTVWGDRFVSESALTSRIKAARQAIGDDGKAQRLVRTVHGRGYQFVAEVTELDEHPSPSSSTDPLPEQEIRFCTADDGTRLAYATMGSGRPLVKVANWLSHLDYDRQSVVWRHWLIELARRFRLVRYDERGCGLSDWDVPEFSFEAWVRDLEAVVDAVPAPMAAEVHPALRAPVGAADEEPERGHVDRVPVGVLIRGREVSEHERGVGGVVDVRRDQVDDVAQLGEHAVGEALGVADRGARLVERRGDLRGRLDPHPLGEQLDRLDAVAQLVVDPHGVDPVRDQRGLEARGHERAAAKQRDPVRAGRRQVAGECQADRSGERHQPHLPSISAESGYA